MPDYPGRFFLMVHSDGKMKKWRDAEKDMVVERLTAKADGM